MNRLASLMLALPLALVLCTCSREPGVSVPAAKPVRVAEVAAVSASAGAVLDGLVAPREETRMAFKVPGVIGRIAVEEGDAVRPAQVLAELLPVEVEARLLQARERAAKAERDLQRARSLFERGLVASQSVEDARTGRDLARADLDTAGFERNRARIVAESAGIVLKRLAEPGETIAAGAPVIVVTNAARGWVLRTGVPDRVAVTLDEGVPARVTIDAWPGRDIPGRIRRIAAASDNGTGTITVDVAFTPPAGLRAMAGLVGRASILPPVKPASPARLSIPVGALLEGDGESAHVFRLAADSARVKRVDVTTDGIAGDRVYIRAGLTAGDRVVSEGAAWLDDGDAVTVLP